MARIAFSWSEIPPATVDLGMGRYHLTKARRFPVGGSLAIRKAIYGHDQGPSCTKQRRLRRRLRCRRLRRLRLGPRFRLGPAERARGRGPQPRVDAVDVEDVPAVGQLPHLVPVRELRQAHGAVGVRPSTGGRASGALLLTVRRDRQRGERGRVQPAPAADSAERVDGPQDASPEAPAAAGARHEGVQQEADEDEDEGEREEDEDGREQDARAEPMMPRVRFNGARRRAPRLGAVP
ncbi:hypothetical protein BRADI_2g06885v3 [Brachypodium distachyon]|uniref:Uncharacterized protein n=1 Tax=Brachypodium distachyon TaxID=15368 RepID=A0A0Q3IBQ1_BRADI|nr:hypothetical protein BRADI_2g06885v3 [Brachypodium distachyon]